MAAFSVSELAQLVGGRVFGDGATTVTGFAGVREARPGDVTFASDARWADQLSLSQASAVVLGEERDDLALPQIVVSDPNLAFAQVVEAFRIQTPPAAGVHPRAVVDTEAEVDATAWIGPCAVVSAGARVGARTFVGAGVFLGAGVQLGEDVHLHPNVTILDGTRIGDRVIIHSGSVLGSDGFGYATTPDGRHVKIPQTGIVVVDDDVEIGANVCVDRARFHETRIGAGSKIDNLVQIAHNVRIGRHAILAGTVAVAGSAVLGDHVVLGGGAVVTGHVEVGDGAQISAMSGVSKNLPGGQAYLGVPAIPIHEGKKVRLLQMRLPELNRRVRELERRLAEWGSPKDPAEDDPGESKR